jgi:hypothetical protein
MKMSGVAELWNTPGSQILPSPDLFRPTMTPGLWLPISLTTA